MCACITGATRAELEEAAEARHLAATFSDAAAIRDLLAYAEALDGDWAGGLQ